MIFGRSDVETITSHVELHEATSADVRVKMAVGELTARGGATGLMDGTFTFSRELEPEVRVEFDNRHANLRIRQPEARGSRSSSRNEWDIALNGAIPLGLRIDMATGEAMLDASDLLLTRLALHSATGKVTARVDGNQSQLTEVDIDSTVGAADVSLRGAYDTLRTLSVNTTTGAVDLDLRGTFRRDLDATVKASTGAVKIKLPHDIGVEVVARTSIGKVSARGLSHDGNAYRNALFGLAPVTLRMTVSASIGTISLESER